MTKDAKGRWTMNAKKVITAVLSVGGMIGLGVFCKNKISPKTIEKTVEVVKEPMFKNVPLSKLQEIAKNIHFKNELFLDSSGDLKLLYKSNRGHQTNVAKFGIDRITKKLVPLNGSNVFAYPGQSYSHADKFLRTVNEMLDFE